MTPEDRAELRAAAEEVGKWEIGDIRHYEALIAMRNLLKAGDVLSLLDEFADAEEQLGDEMQRADAEFSQCWAWLKEIRCAYYDDPKASDGACPDDMPAMIRSVLGWMRDLRAQLAEARADRERLDWLEKQKPRAWSDWLLEYDESGLVVVQINFCGEDYDDDSRFYRGTELREAIDAAREES